jgi:hypothetical protein
LEGSGFGYAEDLGFPGQYPYTRGRDSLEYRGNFWFFQKYAGFGDAEETNKRYKYLLDHGQTGLSIALNLPTHIGIDSNHPMAEGEVRKVGVAINSLEDIEIIFKDIPLNRLHPLGWSFHRIIGTNRAGSGEGRSIFKGKRGRVSSNYSESGEYRGDDDGIEKNGCVFREKEPREG